MDNENIFNQAIEQAIEQPIIGISVLVVVIIVIAASIAFLVYYDKTKSAPMRRQAAQEAKRRQIEFIRKNPLSQYFLCKSCGWIGRSSTSNLGSGTGIEVLGGGTASIGGGAAAAAGLGSSIIGIALIIIGIPLLLLCGIGVIPIIIGSMFLIFGGFTTTAGTVVAGTGAIATQSAMNKLQIQKKQICFVCKNSDLIPVYSPIAKDIIESNPHLSSKVKEIEISVIAGLPKE